jgi:hypothetical protein
MIFTVGHSNHSLEHFLQLLAGRRIGAIADIRGVRRFAEYVLRLLPRNSH